MGIRFEHAEIHRGSFTLKVDMSIPNGASVALIGPSGGGKSSLLAAIAGFVPLKEGRLFLEGEDALFMRPAERPVTLLFQEHNLFPHLNVFQNVGLGRRPDLKLDDAAREAVETALKEVGLSGLGLRYPGDLSGGQRQRVALARALLRDKPILLLDEPFAALGPALKDEMLDLVARIRAEQNATLVMVTHQPHDAQRIAEETVLIEGGRAHAPELTEVLFAHPPQALRDYLGN